MSRQKHWMRPSAIIMECSDLARTGVSGLDRSFITPLDREDIHMLASRLDDILDRHERLADQLLLRRTRIFLDPSLEQVPHFVLVPGRRLNRVPAVFHKSYRASRAIPSTRISWST